MRMHVKRLYIYEVLAKIISATDIQLYKNVCSNSMSKLLEKLTRLLNKIFT